jgi:hypothetical protein
MYELRNPHKFSFGKVNQILNRNHFCENLNLIKIAVSRRKVEDAKSGLRNAELHCFSHKEN